MEATRKYRYWGRILFVLPLVMAVGVTAPRADETDASAFDASEVTASHSAHIDVLLSWGKYALESSRFKEAESRFRDVLELDWNNRRAYELLQNTRTRRAETLRSWARAG